MAANSTAGKTLRIGIAGLGVGGSNALGEATGMRGHEHVKLVAAADPVVRLPTMLGENRVNPPRGRPPISLRPAPRTRWP